MNELVRHLVTCRRKLNKHMIELDRHLVICRRKLIIDAYLKDKALSCAYLAHCELAGTRFVVISTQRFFKT